MWRRWSTSSWRCRSWRRRTTGSRSSTSTRSSSGRAVPWWPTPSWWSIPPIPSTLLHREAERTTGEREGVVQPGDDDGFRDHLDAILIGGRERRDIAVEPYDPAWPARYQLERDRITAALGEEMVAVHH